jgi:transcriptional regulator with XRE-family HTH domain
MISSKQLSQMLGQVNVYDLSQRSGVSEKTIYRLRHEKHSPTLKTLTALLDAAKQLGWVGL